MSVLFHIWPREHHRRWVGNMLRARGWGGMLWNSISWTQQDPGYTHELIAAAIVCIRPVDDQAINMPTWIEENFTRSQFWLMNYGQSRTTQRIRCFQGQTTDRLFNPNWIYSLVCVCVCVINNK